MNNNHDEGLGCGCYIFIVILVMVLLSVVYGCSKNQYTQKYTVTITDKERATYSGDRDSEYLVFAQTADGEDIVFKNIDTIWRLKWNSSDIQAKLKVGETYTLTVTGFRSNILSEYQNIIEVKEQ